MPVQRWNDFLAAHDHPVMVFADVMDGQTPQQSFDVVRRLVVAMDFKGGFALFPEKGFVRVAFELESDADVFARAVKATKTARENGWSCQWAFGLDKQAIWSALELVKSLAEIGKAKPPQVTQWTPWTTSGAKGSVSKPAGN